MPPDPDDLRLPESDNQADRATAPDRATFPDHASEAGPFDHDVEYPLLDAVIGHLPEFLPTYLALAEACDDDPGEPAVFVELADFVSDRLAILGTQRPELERALGIVEAHLNGAGDTDDAADLVGLAFFDSFSPEDRRRLIPWLGPRSLATLEALDVPTDG